MTNRAQRTIKAVDVGPSRHHFCHGHALLLASGNAPDLIVANEGVLHALETHRSQYDVYQPAFVVQLLD